LRNGGRRREADRGAYGGLALNRPAFDKSAAFVVAFATIAFAAFACAAWATLSGGTALSA